MVVLISYFIKDSGFNLSCFAGLNVWILIFHHFSILLLLSCMLLHSFQPSFNPFVEVLCEIKKLFHLFFVFLLNVVFSGI